MISALLELQWADADRSAQFNCATCHERVRALRRCDEDRWDFGPEDAAFWPIQVSKGGDFFGFCPAKATWDQRVQAVYTALVVCAETGTQWVPGGIANQPTWWVQLTAWFLPRYNDLRFGSRARAILGSAAPTGGRNGNHKRPA